VRAPAKGGPLDPTAGPSRHGKDSAALLLASGIFDAEHYSASVGQSFDSIESAARHCVEKGLPQNRSPHPLLAAGSMPEDVREAWQRGDLAVVLDHLRSAEGLARPYGPLFHPAALEVPTERLAAHAGGALGHFLETATPQTLLPVPDDYPGPTPTLEAAREAMIAFARLFVEQKALAGPRTRRTWNTTREAEWIATWIDAPLPDVQGPLVSVVTPVRDRPEQILEAIASVQAQSLTSWELLIVDDGSTDETPDVVLEAARGDERIRLLRQDWAGVSAARNTALSHAEGRYVAFLDSDNTWRPDFLRIAVAAMHGNGLDAGYAAVRLVDPAAGDRYRAFNGGLEHLLVLNHIDLNVLVCRTDLAREVGGFDTALRRWVDHDFALRVARRTRLSLLRFIGCDYDDSRGAPDRITTTESQAWQYVALGNNWVDWADLEARAGERVAGRVSVVIPTYNDFRMTIDAVAAVLQDADGHDVEVVVIDNGSRREVGSQLTASFVAEPRVVYRRLPRNLNFAIGCNVGFAESTGEAIVFLNNDTEVRRGWLDAMLPRLSDDVAGVQPLLLYADDTIQTAGTVFVAPDALPTHFLVSQPKEDASGIGDEVFSAVTAAAVLVRAQDVARLRGFDPIYVNGMEDIDLCLRLAELRPGGFRVEPRAVVTHFESKSKGRHENVESNRATFMARWSGRLPAPELDRYTRRGLAVAHIASDGLPVPSPRPVIIRPAATVPGTQVPRLRWGIRLPSVPGPKGDLWGDTHLAESLAEALRRLGQEVVTYRHGAHNAGPVYLDDVVLGIRGLDVIRPQPGQVNALWVISHPDDVAVSEFVGFQLVFAASVTWAEQMSERSGRPVQPLLQATDSHRLPAADSPRGPGTEPVFVGQTTARRERVIVRDALAAGIDFAVHGPGWTGVLPPEVWRSVNVPNADLLSCYREHGLVFADHWPDMAAGGFIANRLFDAVASGARVISDDVPGIHEIFGSAVQIYRSVEDLAFLCSAEGLKTFPDDDELDAIAARVAVEHSFDHRAQELLDAVLKVRRAD
jgi:glycosyltransferase involved in cell wall biosynthesis